MIRQLRTLLVSFSLFTLCSLAFAQNAQIQGQVSDPSGKVIPRALVRVVNQQTGTERQVETNGSGQYSVPGLDPSLYKVFVQAPGFSTAVSTLITLNVAQNAVLDFKLQVGQEAQTVNVDGSGLNINTTDGSVSTVVDRNFVEDIPLNGRSLQSLETLTPGVVAVQQANAGGLGTSGELSVNGQRAEGNQFVVDGISANTGAGYSFGAAAGISGSVPGETALGTTQSLVPIDGLQEFRATTSTYSAEYGRSPGGQFTFSTRAGTDSWHGDVYEYLRNSTLDAANWFDNYSNPPVPKSAERQNDFGGSLGGPVRLFRFPTTSHKTFFFASYEGLRLEQPLGAITQAVPSLNLRQQAPVALQAFLNAWPIPNGADLGNGQANFTSGPSSPAQLDTGSIRIDQNMGNHLTLFGRYSDSPSISATRSQYNSLSVLSNTISNVKTATIGATYFPSSALANDARVGYTRNTTSYATSQDTLGGAVPLSLTALGLPQYYTFYIALNYGSDPALELAREGNFQSQINLRDTLSLGLGHHNVKAGVDYRRIATQTHPIAFEEEGLFTNQAQILDNSASTVEAYSQSLLPVEPIYTNLSLFIQDDWKRSDRLSLSLGLRWELNPPPGDAYGNVPYTVNETSDLAASHLSPKGTPLWKTGYTNFAPRLGMAYVVNKDRGRDTVVRAGGGLFYETGNTLASQGLTGIGYASSVTYSGLSFPLTSAQRQLPPASTSPPYNAFVYAYAPHLALPMDFQWSAALEQSFGTNQTLTLTYVGSAGRKQLATEEYYPSKYGNTNFTTSGRLYLTHNAATSSYQALDVAFQRKLSRNLQCLVGYTWSHSIDEASSNFLLDQLLRADSDFDIRNNFQLAAVYNIPALNGPSTLQRLLSHWSIDARSFARTATPVEIYDGYTIDPDTGIENYVRPNLVSGQTLYSRNSTAPGGRVINFNAFVAPVAGTVGNTPRNYARGFGAAETDLAVERTFPLTERTRLLFRAEAFNIGNHPMFGQIYNELTEGKQEFGYAYNTLNESLGGLSPIYQIGGPRSLQLALRIQF